MMQVDPSNADQRDSWDGPGGGFWAENADRMDAALSGYTEPFFAAAALRPGERVLDVGCGNGFTSCEAARRGARVLGVDLSAEMLAVARERAARDGLAGDGSGPADGAPGQVGDGSGLAGGAAGRAGDGSGPAGGAPGRAEFVQADAQVHDFPPGGFDAVISRHGTMFFGDPPAAFGNLARALRPGGRLVLLVWRGLADNEWLREFLGALSVGGPLPVPPPGAPGPMSLADPERLRGLLSGVGFADPRLEPVERPMWFGTDGEDAFARLPDQFGWLISSLPPWSRGRALAALREVVLAHETPDGVLFGSAAWVVTAVNSPVG